MMKLIAILLFVTALKGSAQTIQHDNMLSMNFAEIQPVKLLDGTDTVTLSRLYIHSVSDTTVDIFLMYLADSDYIPFISSYGFITGKVEDIFSYVADNLYIPVRGTTTTKINIVYK